jgi:aminoglycoside/choline kinase family phosphotransferase/choline kinase
MNEARAAGFPAMILAAGYGTRLAPVTDHVPKPLLPVGGRTLLDHAVDAVIRAGAETVAVNTHHLAEMIGHHLAARPDAGRFRHCHEPEIMGTGGALDGARVHLQGHPFFLLHNADVLCDADLGALVDEHERTGAEATLLLVDWPEVNSVTFGADGAILAIGEDPSPAAGSRRLTYTGIGVFGEEILADIGPGFSSLIDPLGRAMNDRPGSVRGFAPDELDWHDLGTLGRWLAVQGDEARQQAGPGSVSAITGHGSDRRFWRLEIGDWSAVAMLADPGDPEFPRGADIAVFLHDRDLGGAEVLVRDDAAGALLTADLGATSLFDLARTAGTDLAPVYRTVVKHLISLQGATDMAGEACPAAVDRRLDIGVLRWETDYFRARFLEDHMGFHPAETPGLAFELDSLNKVVGAQPLVLLHRDYQSQNIIVRGGEIGVVDVQGMRLGPVGYDIMSLLWDPYVDLGSELRRELMGEWAEEASRLPLLAGYSPVQLRDMAFAAGLQRLMQALGAYGYLGRVKGKREFLDHVPAALARLDELIQEVNRFRPSPSSWLPSPLVTLQGWLERCGDGSGHRPLDGTGPGA